MFGRYVDAVLLRPLPVPDSSRIVVVDSTTPETRLGRTSYADYVDLRDGAKTVQALACYDFFLAGIAARANDELPTPCSPSECSTRLSHVPTRLSQLTGSRLLGSSSVYTRWACALALGERERGWEDHCVGGTNSWAFRSHR